ncbi:hypothetical protein EDB84DRAFT_1446623 [Lactarius hengduanensis]|nr:hypothetical protein EDB84DRAFT_1446623 [Lactarius hengduanensis]
MGSRTSQTELRPATLAQVPKASKRSSPLCNWRDGLWSSEGDGGGEGYPSGAASLREKTGERGVSKRSSEPTHKVNQTEGSKGVEERPYDKRRVEEGEQANPHRVNRTLNGWKKKWGRDETERQQRIQEWQR